MNTILSWTLTFARTLHSLLFAPTAWYFVHAQLLRSIAYFAVVAVRSVKLQQVRLGAKAEPG